MGFLNHIDVVPHFEAHGSNSSHFVWLIGDFQFYLSSAQILFAFKTRANILFLALEPLGAELSSPLVQQGLEELRGELSYETLVWVSVYGPFSSTLQKMSYSVFPIGKEPWLDLTQKVATGKLARGVKSARNQALRDGCQVEEWSGSEVLTDSLKRSSIERVLVEWSSRRKIFLGNFLNSSDPFAHRSYRRYFVGRDGGGTPRAYLVATLIPSSGDYFLEDLVLGNDSPRGIGELLVLTACEKLAEAGVRRASLGVVSGVSKRANSGMRKTPWVVRSFSKLLEKFYNLEGMEVFRKRFQPKEWQSIYIAAKHTDGSELRSVDWAKIFWNLLLVFEPSLQLRYRLPHGRSSPHSVASQDSAELGA